MIGRECYLSALRKVALRALMINIVMVENKIVMLKSTCLEKQVFDVVNGKLNNSPVTRIGVNTRKRSKVSIHCKVLTKGEQQSLNQR